MKYFSSRRVTIEVKKQLTHWNLNNSIHPHTAMALCVSVCVGAFDKFDPVSFTKG